MTTKNDDTWLKLLPDAAVAFDEVGRIQDLNVLALRMLGGDAARWVGQPFAALMADNGALSATGLLEGLPVNVGGGEVAARLRL